MVPGQLSLLIARFQILPINVLVVKREQKEIFQADYFFLIIFKEK